MINQWKYVTIQIGLIFPVILINGREKVRIKHEKNPKVFNDYSQTIDDIY